MTQKFATRSTCLTYEFTTDELGFKEITQVRKAAKKMFLFGSIDPNL